MNDVDSILLRERKKIDDAIRVTQNNVKDTVSDSVMKNIRFLMKWSYERGKVDLLLHQGKMQKLFKED